jgi:hypothetical protein
MTRGMLDDIVVNPKASVAHKMCQNNISSVCAVCQRLSIRKEGDKKHSHCEDGFFEESHRFNRMDGVP